MKKLSLALICAVSASYATAISDIKYEGLTRISPMIADQMAGLMRGQQLNYDRIGKSILDFYAQGYFEDIWVEEKDGVLIYHFKEKPVVSKIDIVGYSDTEKEKMEADLGVKKGDSYDEERIEKSKRSIMKKIEQEGYFNTVIEVDKKESGDGAVELSYIINKGEKIYIEKLNLFGTKSIKKDKLLSQTANREKEFLGWFWGRNDGKLHLEELEYDSSRIKDVYMQHGFLDAAVSSPFLRTDFTSYTATLDFNVKEGEAYRVSELKTVLKTPVVEEAKLREGLKLKKGEIFNIEKLRKDIELIKNRVADMGYAFTLVTPDFQKDEKSHSAKIVYVIDPGQKVSIRNVLISGNGRTLDSVIRREVFLAPGDTYSLTDMTDSKNALKRTGYFEDVTIDEKRISADKMDLIVKVKEAPTGSIMVGGGYGSYDGLMFNAGISDKNIFGSGLNLGFNVDVSKKQANFDLSLYNSRLMDSKYSLGFNLFNRKYISYDYTEKSSGASLTTGKQLTRTLFAGATYQYVKINYEDINSTYYFDLVNTTKSSVTPYLNFDNTDDYYLPRHGVAASTNLEFAGLGGQEKYVKSFTKLGVFQGLEDWIGYDIIARYKARLGYIFKTDQMTRGSKFFMGGLSSVRGYQSSSISQIDTNGYRVGDTKTFSNSFELNFPLVDAAKMRYSLFFDYGMIGTDKFNEQSRAGIGATLEWFSPMGPIQIVYAKPLNEKAGDKTSNIEFTIGSRF